MKRVLSFFVMCIFTITMFGGCSVDNNSNVINISILNSKPEIEDALSDIIKEFTNKNEDINIKLVKYSQNGSYIDTLESMHERGNTPTISLVDTSHISLFKNDLLNLSSEEWVNDISGEVSELAKNKDGDLIAFPFSVEGTGFIYNKTLLNKAGVDASKIKTIQDLEEAFKAVESYGKKALVVTNEEWSLGDHFLSTFYAVDQGKSDVSTENYFKNLKNSNLKDNEVLNGLIDTFDIMKKYNIYSNNPLAPSYEKCAEILGSGEVAFWYMGNWVSQSILSNDINGDEFGFIPVPISNNASDFGNNELAIGVTKYIIIDSANNSKEQQEAAKRFLNYLICNEDGNKFLVEGAGIIPYFKNVEVNSDDSLTNEIIKNINNDTTMELMNSYLPSNNSQVLGGALRKYLNNEITRENLIDTIIDFWRNQ